MWRLLSNLVKALAYYYQLKAERFAHDIIEQSRSKIETFTEELESLRDSGDESSTQHADRLRERIIAEKAHLKRISTKLLEG